MIPFKILDVFPPLLDTFGIEKLWKNLLYTFVSQDHSDVFPQIEHSVHFLDAQVLEENFLHGLSIGEIGVLYEFSLSYSDRAKRKENGQYFTPDDVAQKMVALADSFPENKIWLDPCCGVGNLSYWLIAQQENSEKFLAENMRFADLDPLALIICCTLMTAIFYKNNSQLFEQVEKNALVSNFLDDGSESNIIYDYILMNPPYADTKPDLRFETHKIHDSYAYFMEKAIKTSQGFISVTPQSFTHATKYEVLRKLLLDNGNRINVYCFDNMPDSFFKGFKYGSQNTNTVNSVRAAITVFQKDANIKEHGITSLMRWRTAERKEFLNKFKDILNISEHVLTPHMFYRNISELNSFFEHSLTLPTLKDIVSPVETQYALYIPGTPRYFISAVSKPLARSSTRILYFNNEYDLLYAYSLLNSRVVYWWWRLVDGGMTISLSTLMTLPLPSYQEIDNDILKQMSEKLLVSENINVVIKNNAGVASENIKHPETITDELTVALTDENTNISLKKLYSNTVVNWV